MILRMKRRRYRCPACLRIYWKKSDQEQIKSWCGYKGKEVMLRRIKLKKKQKETKHEKN